VVQCRSVCKLCTVSTALPYIDAKISAEIGLLQKIAQFPHMANVCPSDEPPVAVYYLNQDMHCDNNTRMVRP
jgi:hypothetical protein